MRILEVCVDSVASAVQAEEGGADRLELCADLVVGGVTPTLSLYERVREKVKIPIHVLLRPRFGDFLYDEEEFEVLRRQARAARQAGADALVIGCLTPQGRLCIEQMERLMEEAGGKPVTLHRAFDMCSDLDQALEDAKKLGIHTILTSGGQASAQAGMETLARLQKAAGTLSIMAGAGIEAGAIRKLLRHAELSAFHMSGKRIVESRMVYRNPSVSMGLEQLSEYELWQTDARAVRQAKAALLEDY
jgi:copper homeostasis protein